MQKTVVEKTVETVESITCDVCSNVIVVGSKALYYEVSTMHNHWGSDSWESREHYDMCSKECLMKHLQSYIDQSNVDGYSYDIETEQA